MRGATRKCKYFAKLDLFQSASLMRGATSRRRHQLPDDISIHALCRSDTAGESVYQLTISIHAPHARSDILPSRITVDNNGYFNPRSSCEERQQSRPPTLQARYFQSTLLMRGATCSSTRRRQSMIFQSTLLMRGATQEVINYFVMKKFQSTLLMRGATASAWLRCSALADFNPRSSCEERQDAAAVSFDAVVISIHAPHARSD